MGNSKENEDGNKNILRVKPRGDVWPLCTEITMTHPVMLFETPRKQLARDKAIMDGMDILVFCSTSYATADETLVATHHMTSKE